VRSVEHVKRDIDLVLQNTRKLRLIAGSTGRIPRPLLHRAAEGMDPREQPAFSAAYRWLYAGGMKSVFLQDANSLVIKPDQMVEILAYLAERFPSVERITTYARAHTIARMADGDLAAIGRTGLNRIHIGLESGSDEVLKRVLKGVTKKLHIEAGLKVKAAGMELSEYYMPGLGGEELWQTHALETADALNKINPDFIRLRTLAIPPGAPLFNDCTAGRFSKCAEVTVVKELLLFLQHLDGITSAVTSDHVLNLLSDLEGRLPEDKEHMIGITQAFLAMDPGSRMVYQIGRRFGIFSSLADMDDPHRMDAAKNACEALRVTADNVDGVTAELMQRFI
jgi:hypothetical protein